MTRAEAWCLHASNVLVGGTGLVYGWMRYFAQSEDEFAIVNHPWQPTFQHAHVVVAPLLVFAVAMVWRLHVWKRIRSGFRSRRNSGWALFLMVWPMILSGYLLQVSAEEFWRQAWVAVHVATSALWCMAYLVHPVRPKA